MQFTLHKSLVYNVNINCILGDIIIKEGTIGTKMYFIQASSSLELQQNFYLKGNYHLLILGRYCWHCHVKWWSSNKPFRRIIFWRDLSFNECTKSRKCQSWNLLQCIFIICEPFQFCFGPSNLLFHKKIGKV